MKPQKQTNGSTYLKVSDYVISSKMFTDSEILIFSKIVSLSNTKLGCIATDDWFADYFNKSKRQIQRILEKLRNDGWINSKLNYGDPNNRSKVTKRKIELTQPALDLILHGIAPPLTTEVEPQEDNYSEDVLEYSNDPLKDDKEILKEYALIYSHLYYAHGVEILNPEILEKEISVFIDKQGEEKIIFKTVAATFEYADAELEKNPQRPKFNENELALISAKCHLFLEQDDTADPLKYLQSIDDNDKNDAIDDNDKSDAIDDNDKSDIPTTPHLTSRQRRQRRPDNATSDVDIILSDKKNKKIRGEGSPPAFLSLGEEDKGVEFMDGYIEYLENLPFFKSTDEKIVNARKELYRYKETESKYKLIVDTIIYKKDLHFLNRGYYDTVKIHTKERLLKYAYEYAEKNNISTDGIEEENIYSIIESWLDALALFYEYEKENPKLLPKDKNSENYLIHRKSLIKQFYELLDKLGESRAGLSDTMRRISENGFLSSKYLATPINLLDKDEAGNYKYWSVKAEVDKKYSNVGSQEYPNFVN